MKTMTTARRSTLLLALFLLTGCVSGQRSPEESIYLVIENRRSEMVTIHAMRHSTRFRIGMVQGLSTREFVIKPHMVGAGGQLRLAVDPLGDPNKRYTRSITVDPGDRVRLELTF